MSACSTSIVPRPILIRHVAEAARRSGSPRTPRVPLRFEPAGSSTVTSIEPPSLRGSHWRSFGALTSSRSFAKSIRVAFGGADVVVVGRVARAHVDDGGGAVAGGDPDVAEAEVDRWPRSGVGVSNVGMGMPSCGQVRSDGWWFG